MTTLVRYPNPETATWTPFDRLSALRQEMERLWDWNVGARTAPVSSGWSPALDLFDTEDKLMAVRITPAPAVAMHCVMHDNACAVITLITAIVIIIINIIANIKGQSTTR